MRVYVFVNISFFVVVIYGFWKIVEVGEFEFGSDVNLEFVDKNFYVDDVLKFVIILVKIIDLL